MGLERNRSPLTEEALEDAMMAKKEGRPPVFWAVYPTKTMAVSVTGKACPLACSHCGGHYLKHMVDIKRLPEALLEKRPKSILLSGGCDTSGAVPLLSHLDEVSALSRRLEAEGRGFRVNVHPGVATPEAARAIARTASVISFDFVLDEETIREAFHGKWTGRDYVETFRNLRAGNAEVVPHVLVGLYKGRLRGEYDAVDFLLKEGIDRIIFIVFIPTENTAWQDYPPPTPEEVAGLIAWTRTRAPELDISLGCMRPRGKYRELLDPLAVRAGCDRIVLPHPRALREAEALGLTVIRKEECCSFDRI
ncbi:MAG: radical SAM protein [Bacillota bacterium]|jgi:uncharacterized radical SAM superfamily protein|nr:radical SAM protein [Candidatus Fermentithermobacillaceae bacterium]